MNMNKLYTTSDRFKRNYRVDKSGCFIWNSYNGKFYPSFLLGRVVKAHIASYILFKGEIPEGNVVRHTCDNMGCVNPDHLVIGTQKENIRDCIDRGRFVRGSKSHFSKLKPKQVLDVREKWKTGNYKQKELASLYGVRQQTISKIVNNVKWKEVV